MSPEEVEYYRQRAAAERQYAAQSTNPHAVVIHRKLAMLYEQLLELEEAPPRSAQWAKGAGATA